jgi:YfiH family protein
MTEPQPNGGFKWMQAGWGAALRCTALEPIARHVFTARNLQLRADRAEWDALAREMDVATGAVRLIKQVHEANIAIVRGGDSQDWMAPEADAILSDRPDVAIAVRVADCAPILLADRRVGVVGAVHAGWRGTMKQIAGAAVRALVSEFGSDPQDLVAAIGPCLGPCCGEVGLEVVDAFRTAGHSPERIARWFGPGRDGRANLNLWAANRDQLEAAGVPSSQIHTAALCTKSHASVFHSYRAAGETAGRMAGVIRVSGWAGRPAEKQRPDRK